MQNLKQVQFLNLLLGVSGVLRVGAVVIAGGKGGVSQHQPNTPPPSDIMHGIRTNRQRASIKPELTI